MLLSWHDRVPQAVLQAYSQVRRPRAQAVWELSHRAGCIYEHHGPHGPTREGLAEDLRDMMDPIWHYDLDGDVQSAVQILAENGTFGQR